MKNLRKKFPKPDQSDTGTTAQRRRLAKIVHDDRGAASVEWHDAPNGSDQRPVLELEDPTIARNAKVRGGIEVLHIKNEETFNPYERLPDNRRKEHARRDLRKLSEHIKLMRELEERKKNGGGDE